MKKNIVIQSVTEDMSTSDVILWINHLNKELNITTNYDEIEVTDLKINLNNDNCQLDIANTTINDKTSFWYRRGMFYNDNIGINKIYNESYKTILKFLEDNFAKNQLNKFKDNKVYKLKMLYEAVNLGIKIPDTLATTNGEDVKKFISKNKIIIAKSLENPFFKIPYKNHEITLTTHTNYITEDSLTKVPQKFLPTLFQEYIEKQFEIRTFYLKGEFKSMVIFSQQNEKTKIDFRNYDYARPNRNVPFQLPKNLEKKLHKLMLKLNLDCGSFDIIYTPNGEYYFLEVNPIGQFQWVSSNCNYFLERMIAETLIDYDKRER